MLQSDLPAGKEANSGNDVGQGALNSMLNLLSLATDEVSKSTGMTAQTPQGDNPGITELDKYRQVIANLLEVLSGEITDNSSKGTALSSVSAGPKDLSQEMAKIVQGWMMTTDEVSEEGKGSIGQKGIQPVLDALTSGMGTGNPELKARVSTLLATLYPTQSQGVKDTTTPQGVNLTLQGRGRYYRAYGERAFRNTCGSVRGNRKRLRTSRNWYERYSFSYTHPAKISRIGWSTKE